MLVHLRIMMGWISIVRGVTLSRAAACALAWGACACGTEGEKATLFEPLQSPGQVRDFPPDPPATTPTPVVVVEPAAGGASGMLPAGMAPNPSQMPEPTPVAEDRQAGACQAALGVSATPETIPQALILLNTLPKPTTLECFLQALERPLNVYFTSSALSLQPAPDARSPRTFIQRGSLYMSFVFGGYASDTLEFGYRPVPNRSIKAEIVFPITRDLTEDSLFDRIALTDSTTQCGACHTSEAREEFPGFPEGAYVSDIFEPYESLEVDLETMRTELAGCDESAGLERCLLLSALFENGPLRQGELLSAGRL
ncbi:MAG: hypothetical protein RL685_5837 [Pseudomonadota bacterium]|jgi:hypothetical protein